MLLWLFQRRERNPVDSAILVLEIVINPVDEKNMHYLNIQ